ncbi:hypothetical protein IFM89_034318 [Coptis chinensis]|uniref:Uncharacterized protein n=1 Tax=Coptis chinensis TaxID=261450 RepID=A0A835M5I0_9MAGN|nr:hypothetical protein IFM89_034318 [Coptis chinensis]
MRMTTSSSSSDNHPTIVRVPPYIRKEDCNAYDPQIISIGPYHRDKLGLEKTMQVHKQNYQTHLLQRTNKVHADVTEVVKSLENEARKCYVNIDANYDFSHEMGLDGCFIIELLLKLWEIRPAEKEKKPPKNWRDKTPAMQPSTSAAISNEIQNNFVLLLPQITLDLLLLENQIPFLILETLFNHTVPKGENQPVSLRALATAFFKSFINVSTEVSDSDHIHHLLHLFHKCLVMEKSRKRTVPIQRYFSRKKHEVSGRAFVHSNVRQILLSNTWTPSASELLDAGIQLRKDARGFYKKNADNFMDIKFADQILDIPPLAGHAYPILRSLIAFEHLNPSSGSDVTAYAYLFSALVKSTNDVTLLRNKKIIPGWLGTEEEVAKRLNKLCEGVVIFEFKGYIWDVIAKINAVCDLKPTKCEKLTRNLRKGPIEALGKYVEHPWRVLSVFGTIGAIIYTFYIDRGTGLQVVLLAVVNKRRRRKAGADQNKGKETWVPNATPVVNTGSNKFSILADLEATYATVEAFSDVEEEEEAVEALEVHSDEHVEPQTQLNAAEVVSTKDLNEIINMEGALKSGEEELNIVIEDSVEDTAEQRDENSLQAAGAMSGDNEEFSDALNDGSEHNFSDGEEPIEHHTAQGSATHTLDSIQPLAHEMRVMSPSSCASSTSLKTQGKLQHETAEVLQVMKLKEAQLSPLKPPDKEQWGDIHDEEDTGHSVRKSVPVLSLYPSKTPPTPKKIGRRKATR